MVAMEEIDRLLVAGGDVVGDDGKKIGSIGEVFLDAKSGEPAWVTVRTGLFGTSESFVPLTGATVRESEIHVPFTKDTVKHAPRMETAGGHLSGQEERELYRYYGLHDDDGDVADRPLDTRDQDLHQDERVVGDEDASHAHGRHVREDVAPDAVVGHEDVDHGAHVLPAHDADRDAHLRTDDVDHDVRTPAPDHGGMTRSEERVKVVGTERVPTERVRMRRYTVTEMRDISVPVTREEVRVEYEPEGPGARGEIVDTDAPGITGDRRPVEPGAPARGTDPSRQ